MAAGTAAGKKYCAFCEGLGGLGVFLALINSAYNNAFACFTGHVWLLIRLH